MASFLLFIISFVLTAMNVQSQNYSALCVAGSIVGNQWINGLYTMAGIHNGYPYYTKQQRSGCNYSSETGYFYWSASSSRWTIYHGQLHESSYTIECNTATTTIDPINCSPDWYNAYIDSNDDGIIIYPDQCPEWECDTIVSTMDENDCGGPFDVKVGRNAWYNSQFGGMYWVWMDNYQSWECKQDDNLYCDSYSAATKKSATWISVEKEGYVNLEYTYPDPGIYSVVCIKNPTIAPTKQPSVSPIESTSKLPTNYPTSFPSEEPTRNPSVIITLTINPSVAPTRNPLVTPTMNPSVTPTINPSVFPTNYPTKYPSVSLTTKSTTDAIITCDNNHAIVTMAFDYELPAGYIYTAETSIDIVYNATNAFVADQTDDFQNCVVSNHKITHIQIKPSNNMHATINISLCTSCTADDIKTSFVDNIGRMDDNNILIVDVSTIEINVDIVNKNDGEATEGDISTTIQIVVDTDRENESSDGSIWAIMVVLFGVICIVIVVVVIYITRRSKTDKEQEMGIIINRSMRIPTESVATTDNNTIKKNVAPSMKTDNNNINTNDDDIIYEVDVNENVVPPGSLPIGSNHEVIIADNDEEQKEDENDTDSEHITDESDHVDIDDNMKMRERGFTDNGDLNNNDDNNDKYLVKQWLINKVKFPQYYDVLIQNGYESFDIIKEITNHEELEEIGIILRGHQTKMLAEIKKLKASKEDIVIPYNAVQVNENKKFQIKNQKSSSVLNEYEGDESDEEEIDDDDIQKNRKTITNTLTDENTIGNDENSDNTPQ